MVHLIIKIFQYHKIIIKILNIDIVPLQVNDERVNDRHPNFVMKSSAEALQIALAMDRQVGSLVQLAFVDFKVTRCPGYKTLTLSTYHEPLEAIVSLAVMEIPSENTAAVCLFFNMFNEMIKRCSQEERLFDPAGWCADEAGAIRVGLTNVSINYFQSSDSDTEYLGLWS